MVGNGALSKVGVSILGIGMITGMHAAISPSVFTFRCFAKSPREKEIAKTTLWISLAATSATSLGILLVFKEWVPAIISQVTAISLFGLGMHAVECTEEAPAAPSMRPSIGPAPLPVEPGRELVGVMRVPKLYAR